MHARDIPVLGGLVDTVIVYVSTLGRFVRRPFGFADGIPFDDPEELKRASKFLGAGIALAYLFITPALSKHSFEVSELLFGIVALFRLLLITVIYHAAFLAVGHRRPIKTSLILGSYINGIYFPFFMAVMVPGYLAIGPQHFFGTLNDQELTAAQRSALEDPVVVLAFLLFLAAYPFFFALASRWWAKAYGANVWMSAALLLVSIVLAGLVNFYVIPPAVRPFL